MEEGTALIDAAGTIHWISEQRTLYIGDIILVDSDYQAIGRGGLSSPVLRTAESAVINLVKQTLGDRVQITFVNYPGI